MSTSDVVVHIVDDEESIRRSASFMLKTSGYAVQTWTSGTEFLKEVRHAEQGCREHRLPGVAHLPASWFLPLPSPEPPLLAKFAKNLLTRLSSTIADCVNSMRLPSFR